MKNTLKVFEFEISNMFRKKSFIISNALIFLLIIGLVSIPRILSGQKNTSKTATVQNIQNMGKIGYFDETGLKEDDIKKQFQGYDVQKFQSYDEVKKEVKEKNLKYGFGINKDRSVNLAVYDLGIGKNYGFIEDGLKNVFMQNDIEKLGVDSKKVDSILNTSVSTKLDVMGKNTVATFVPIYAMILITYATVLFFGQIVSMAVAREKSDRTMEILITSSKPSSLINGKVTAFGVSGIISICLMILAVIIGLTINKNYYGGIMKLLNMSIGLKTIVVFLLFFFTGYMLYLYLYASVGSLVSKVEEVGTSVMPLALIWIVGFFVAMMNLQSPETSIIKISSFIPFISPITMFVRVGMSDVPVAEIITSYLILFVTTIIIGMLSIKIYRSGTLNYGNKVKLSKALRLK